VTVKERIYLSHIFTGNLCSEVEGVLSIQAKMTEYNYRPNLYGNDVDYIGQVCVVCSQFLLSPAEFVDVFVYNKQLVQSNE